MGMCSGRAHQGFQEGVHLLKQMLYFKVMFTTSNVKDLKSLSYKCIFDKPSPMSGRVSAAIIYAVIRAGEIIDWWFPVKNIRQC